MSFYFPCDSFFLLTNETKQQKETFKELDTPLPKKDDQIALLEGINENLKKENSTLREDLKRAEGQLEFTNNVIQQMMKESENMMGTKFMKLHSALNDFLNTRGEDFEITLNMMLNKFHESTPDALSQLQGNWRRRNGLPSLPPIEKKREDNKKENPPTKSI